MKTLNYYISLANKGNADAAYEAAKRMYFEKYNEVMVQAMLRKAATLGNVHAQRWLGFIGLAGRLIDPRSSTSHVTYLTDYTAAYDWFNSAASQGDAISVYAVARCVQHGIGTVKDPTYAATLLETASAAPNSDDLLALMFFFDSHKACACAAQSARHRSIIKDLLAG